MFDDYKKYIIAGIFVILAIVYFVPRLFMLFFVLAMLAASINFIFNWEKFFDKPEDKE